jgi:hypothetical protein
MERQDAYPDFPGDPLPSLPLYLLDIELKQLHVAAASTYPRHKQ